MNARRGRGRTRWKPLLLAAATVLAIAVLPGCARNDAGLADRAAAGDVDQATAGDVDQAASGDVDQAAFGDVEHGMRLFRKCVSCHSLEKNGPNKVGPRLHGLFGRVSGSVSDYKFSRALKKARIVWDEAALDMYLADTTAMVPGTKMYAYMSRHRDRADLIAFLKKATGGIMNINANSPSVGWR